MSAHAEPALIRGLDQALHEGTGGLEELTEREQQVLVLVSDGYSIKEVAARPGIKFKTTACPRSRIMAKCAVHNSVAPLRFAIRKGLVQL